MVNQHAQRDNEDKSRPLRDVSHPGEYIYEIGPWLRGVAHTEVVRVNFFDSGIMI
jgi:hypothetical protein